MPEALGEPAADEALDVKHGAKGVPKEELSGKLGVALPEAGE